MAETISRDRALAKLYFGSFNITARSYTKAKDRGRSLAYRELDRQMRTFRAE